MLSQSSLSFRFGQVIDRDPENENYDADYVLLDYLDGLVTAKRRVDIPAAVPASRMRRATGIRQSF